jgi:hypothetical protein
MDRGRGRTTLSVSEASGQNLQAVKTLLVRGHSQCIANLATPGESAKMISQSCSDVRCKQRVAQIRGWRHIAGSPEVVEMRRGARDNSLVLHSPQR